MTAEILESRSVNTMALPTPLQNLSEHARWLYPLAVVVAATVLGQFFGLGVGLLVFGGGTLGASIWLLWSSLQGLGGEAPITLEEALSLGAPSAEEEQKRAVLRALKDLEYERAVGKITDEDYASLAEHYRSEAKRLLRAVDRDLSPERERAERILAERLAAANVKAPSRRAATEPSPTKAEAAGGLGTDAEGDAVADAAEAEPGRASKSPSSDVAP
jgi:hypothetical protein